MSKHIRRTAIVTLTITETWTVTWASEDDLLHQLPIDGQTQTEEQQDEALQAPLIIAKPDPARTTPVIHPQPSEPGGLPAANSTARRHGKRSRVPRNSESFKEMKQT